MNIANAWIVLFAAGHVLLAMTLVIALAGIASCFLRRHPAARDRLWRAALVGVLASPLVLWLDHAVTADLVTVELPGAEPTDVRDDAVSSRTMTTRVNSPVVSPEPPTRVFLPPPEPVIAPPPALNPSAPVKTAPATASVEKSDRAPMFPWGIEDLATLLATVWIIGCLWHAGRLAVGWLRCRSVLTAAERLDAERFTAELRAARAAIGTMPSVLVSLEVRGPGVVGVLNPRIVLPASLLEWAGSEELVQVLIHEAAHIVRHDPITNFLQAIARCLFWPHPLVHWLNRRLREAREEVCDNVVLAHARGTSYAETLLRVAQRCWPPAPSFAGLAMVPRRGSLERRVGDLLDPKRNHATDWPWSRRLVVQAALLSLLVFVGMVKVETETARADEPAAPSSKEQADDAIQPFKTAVSTPDSAAKLSPVPVTGRVLMPDGAPAKGATVLMMGPPNNGAGGFVPPYPIQKTTTDEHGRYSSAVTMAGQYRLWANLDGMTSRKQRLFDKGVHIPKSGEAPEPVELKLHEALSVRVLVKSAATDKPISEATVDLRWNDLARTFTTNESGVAIVRPLTAERWQFQAFADGHAIEYRWLDLKESKDAQVTFVLDPGATVSGTVRDESGKPIAGAGVRVSVPGAPLYQHQWVHADQRGRYRVEHVPITKVELWGSKMGYKRERVTVPFPAKAERNDITLARRKYAGSIRGIVVDKQGNPIEGATVLNQRPTIAGEPSPDLRNLSENQRWTTTGSDGRFVLERLFADLTGPSVIVRAEGYAPKKIPVKPGPADNPAEVKITLDSGHSIEGRVVDPDDNPIQGATVFVYEAGPRIIANGTTDEQGRFSFDSLPSEARFLIGKKGYKQTSLQKLPLDGEDIVTVALEAEDIIQGRVIDRDGKPVAAARLWWVISRGNPDVTVEGTTDEQGRFTLSTADVGPLEPPRFSQVSDTLWILKEGMQLATARAGGIIPDPKQPRELEIRLEPATDTSFVVVAPDDTPVAGARVEPWHFRTYQGYDIIPKDIRALLGGTSDAEGRVRMPEMPRAGFHTVRAITEQFGTQEWQLGGEPNPPAERTIPLSPTGRIKGRLVSDDPTLARGIRFGFESKDFQSGRAYGSTIVTSDNQGRFVVDAMAAGRLRIDVGRDADALAVPRLPDPETTWIRAGETTTLEIPLERTVLVRGTIRTRDTDQPVPGAEIHVSYGVGRQGATVLSDAAGRYEARVLAGPVGTQVIVTPEAFKNYVQLGEPWNKTIEVPSGDQPFDLPPIRLAPTLLLEGRLVDQEGRPVANVQLCGLKGNRRYAFAETDENGKFSTRVPVGIKLDGYEVWFDDFSPPATPEIVDRDPLTLRVARPIAGAGVGEGTEGTGPME